MINSAATDNTRPRDYSILRMFIGVLLAYSMVAAFGVWTAAALTSEISPRVLQGEALAGRDPADSWGGVVK